MKQHPHLWQTVMWGIDGRGSDVVFAHTLVLSGIDTNALLRDENGGRVEGDSPMESVH